VPFLLGLIYWDNKILRLIFIATSVVFGTTVLLGHTHYSIDVFAAFFITYSIFHIALYLFKKDWELSIS
jgi:membrane-associated phospholipid phosphatase